MAKQRHDIGVQKRLASLPIMRAAQERRRVIKQRRIEGMSEFMKLWMKHNSYRPYPH